jgi:hypothetical protein
MGMGEKSMMGSVVAKFRLYSPWLRLKYRRMKTPHPLMAMCCLALVSTLISSTSAAEIAPPELRLGTKGAALLEEKFDGDALPKGWTINTGKVTVGGGVLHANEVASDMHAGAFRKPVPVQDCAIQVDFKFEGATKMDLGFDPAPGELKKKGHLLSVTITAASWSIIEHLDKADPKSKNVTHATGKVALEKGKWYTLLLESKGDNVVAQIGGVGSLKATSKDFHIKKPGLVFRVAGKDGGELQLDNVKVWELK